MALDEDVERVQRGAETLSKQAKRILGRIINPFQDAAAIFYGPDGRLKPEAISWLTRIGNQAFATRSTFDPDPRLHALNEGKRALFIDILRELHLDTEKLAKATRQQKELKDE